MRVLIADDNADMRLLTRALLGTDARVSVVAEAEDGAQAVVAFRDVRPDVCVLDQQMPRLTGLDAAKQILVEAPNARVLLFSSFLSDDLAADAAELGIQCLRKDRYEDLTDVVIELAG